MPGREHWTEQFGFEMLVVGVEETSVRMDTNDAGNPLIAEPSPLASMPYMLGCSEGPELRLNLQERKQRQIQKTTNTFPSHPHWLTYKGPILQQYSSNTVTSQIRCLRFLSLLIQDL